MSEPLGDKPRILFLLDRRNWAFDFSRSLAAALRDRYHISLRYVRERPRLDPDGFDLMYVFFWGEDYHLRFGVPAEKVIKQVASHRWALEDRYGRLSPTAFTRRHLADCGLVVTPSVNLQRTLADCHPHVYYCPNGVEPSVFHPGRPRCGKLRVAWSGNPRDPCKGLRQILMPACQGQAALKSTSGKWTRRQLAQLYRECDVLGVASSAEGEPLTLIEAMASGCFPVATDVGIVRELVRPGENGLIVDRTVESFREALGWCGQHLDLVREGGRRNAETVPLLRSWQGCSQRFAAVFDYALRGELAGRPLAVPEHFGIANPPLLATSVAAPTERSAWRWYWSDRWGAAAGRLRRTLGKLRPLPPLPEYAPPPTRRAA